MHDHIHSRTSTTKLSGFQKFRVTPRCNMTEPVRTEMVLKREKRISVLAVKECTLARWLIHRDVELTKGCNLKKKEKNKKNPC